MPLLTAERIPFGDLEALRLALDVLEKSCVFIEPVRGEAGVVFPPEGYIAAVCNLARSRGALVVMYEIQTGLGRLGEWWEFLRESCSPDIVLSGKVLSGADRGDLGDPDLGSSIRCKARRVWRGSPA